MTDIDTAQAKAVSDIALLMAEGQIDQRRLLIALNLAFIRGAEYITSRDLARLEARRNGMNTAIDQVTA